MMPMSYLKGSLRNVPVLSATSLALLLIILCTACGQMEQPRQQAHAKNYQEEHVSRHERQKSRTAPGVAGQFDYYVLSLSWAPTFCETPEHRRAHECDPSRYTGFVVHGLWPQRENGRSPEYCGNAPLDEITLHEALGLMPDAGLVRHEWRAHGTCSALSPSTYFDALEKARHAVQIPPPYRDPQRGLRTRPAMVEQRFAQASKIAQHGAVRAHCAGNKLAEVRFCFTKSLEPRTCSESVGGCRTSTIFMDPVH
jgi:ribonuclease T2